MTVRNALADLLTGLALAAVAALGFYLVIWRRDLSPVWGVGLIVGGLGALIPARVKDAVAVVAGAIRDVLSAKAPKP